MEIDYNSFLKIGNMEIIDIRDENEYKKKHLSNAINIPFQRLIVYPNQYLKKDKKYLLVCELGLKSKKTCEILNRNGYQVYSLKNGIKGISL